MTLRLFAIPLALMFLVGCSVDRSPSATVLHIDPNPVMSHGVPGGWDGTDVLNPSVLEFDNKLINYYSGYDGKVWRTGYATSADGGFTWHRLPDPVVDLGQWSTKYIAANGSAVEVDGKVYYYFHGESADNHQQIGLAISQDGKTFNMLPRPVVPAGPAGAWDDLSVADPYVARVGSEYWMYYLTVSHDYKFHMARAISKDGLTWVKDKNPIVMLGPQDDFDNDGAGEPCIFQRNGLFYMVYMGSDKGHRHSIGWATSEDGLTWQKRGLLLPDSRRPSWASEIMGDPTVLPTGKNDGAFYLWFGAGTVANPSQNVNGQIGRMIVKFN